MAWQTYLQPQALPEYLAAVAMVALAVWLVWLDPRRAANLTFALFLLARAASTVSFTIEQLARQAADAAVEWGAERWRAAFTIATVFSLAIFVWTYPRLRARAPRTLLTLGLLLVAFEVAYWIWPALWATYGIRDGLLAQTAVGPFIVFQWLRVPAFGVAALVFARDWTRAKSGPNANALLLMGLAFALHATYDVANSAAFLVRHANEVGPLLTAELVLDTLTVVPILWATALVGVHARRRNAHERALAVRALAALPLPLVTTAFVYLLHEGGYAAAADAANLFFLGLWRLSLPMLATYALVRYGLFELEVRVKRSIQRAVVAVLFVMVFFAVSEGAENLLGGTGTAYGLLAAILLALLLTPLERLAARVASAAMPDVTGVGELSRHERRALFRQLAASAWASGRVSADERRMLDTARDHLSIRREEAERIESEVAARPRATGPARKRRLKT